MSSLDERIGTGHVFLRGKEFFYKGTVPIDGKQSTEVVVMLRSDYDNLSRGNISPLFKYNLSMPEHLIGSFPDLIEYKRNKSDTTYNLYLERIVHTNDPTKTMVMVYKTVEEALDEGEFPDIPA